jgi:hypothetical protein
MRRDRDPTSQGRGRRREGTLEARILEPGLALPGSHIYAGLTPDELAERSGRRQDHDPAPLAAEDHGSSPR